MQLELFDIMKKLSYDAYKYEDKLHFLAGLAEREEWNVKTDTDIDGKTSYPLLLNYIKYTFKRLYNEWATTQDEDKQSILYITDTDMCVNTGLYTDHTESIYMLFHRYDPSLKWAFLSFFPESARELNSIEVMPRKANYFSEPHKLIFNPFYSIRYQASHIFSDINNYYRIPEKYRALGMDVVCNLFDGALQYAKKRAWANYTLAVPQCYDDKIQLLLPISFTKNMSDIDVALTLEDCGTHYRGSTCLTINMAYNNARQICKPSSDWLIPTKL